MQPRHWPWILNRPRAHSCAISRRSRGKQTYRCRQCLYHFIPDSKHPHQPERVKNLAVAMYAEGNSIEAIGRILEIKAGTVYSWVKKSLSVPETAPDHRGAA